MVSWLPRICFEPNKSCAIASLGYEIQCVLISLAHLRRLVCTLVVIRIIAGWIGMKWHCKLKSIRAQHSSPRFLIFYVKCVDVTGFTLCPIL